MKKVNKLEWLVAKGEQEEEKNMNF